MQAVFASVLVELFLTVTVALTVFDEQVVQRSVPFTHDVPPIVTL